MKLASSERTEIGGTDQKGEVDKVQSSEHERRTERHRSGSRRVTGGGLRYPIKESAGTRLERRGRAYCDEWHKLYEELRRRGAPEDLLEGLWLKIVEMRGRAKGPLYPGRFSGRLTTRSIAFSVKRGVKLIGLDATDYSSHSMRAGLVTTATLNRMPETLIMKRTGHKSVETLARYVWPASLFAVDVLAKAL